jgi:alpha-beta hydrolase superfamily lysophospholipase
LAQISRPDWPGRVNEPLYFASGSAQVSAWLHLPRERPRANVGLVICKPFGFESLCAHRSIRAFAEMAADIGVPALRLDYVGTGDSEDIDASADQVDAWVQDVLCAVREMRERTGVERVCLLGIRLGGLLAALAAQRCTGLAGIAWIAPVLSGKRFIREMRATQMAMVPGGPSGAQPGADAGAAASDQGAEFGGYPMSAATLAALSRIDLLKREAPPVRDILVLDRSDLPVAGGWSERLTAAGVRVDYSALPGFVEMALVAPHLAQLPKDMLAATCAWLRRIIHQPAEAGVGVAPSQAASIRVSRTTTLRRRSDAPDSDAAVTERPVCFGASQGIFGIVTEPCPNELRRRGVILLNAGVDYHIGASRMYVSLARSWARRGYFVLRMDLMGIGDSETHPERPGNEVFPPAALDDIRDAVSFLRSEYALREITLAGLCSGAYHALRAAAAELPVNRILMVNPLNFFVWKQGMSLEGLQLAEAVTNPGVYRQKIRSTSAWKRLLSGQVNVMRIVQIYIQRPLLALESALRDCARTLRIRLPRDLGWELEEIAQRGVQMVFVFSRGEAGLRLLQIQAGSAVRKLGDRCRIHIIDNADHTFTRQAPREVMERVLSEELFSHSGSIGELERSYLPTG